MKRNKLTRSVHVILTAVALFSWSMCFALIEKTPLSTLTATPQSPFVNGTSKVTAVDNRFSDMNSQTGSLGANDFTHFYNKKVTNRIILTIDPDQLSGVVTPAPLANPLAYTFSVKLSIVIWKYNPALGSNRMVAQSAIFKTMTVNYDPAKRHTQQAIIELTGTDAGNKIEVTVVNPITFNPVSSNLPYKITLGTQVEVERYYRYGGTAFHITPGSTYNSTSGLLKVNWTLPSADNLPEEYELEWIYIDNYIDQATNITAANLPFNNEYFSKNSTRITTKNAYYQIPVIYPKGFIVYRIRPFWRTYHDGYQALAPGMWSSEDPAYIDDYLDCITTCETEPTEAAIKACKALSCDKLGTFPAGMYYEIGSGSAHETGLNWQYSLSFAEGAKSVASVNYFDGSNKSRQTVVKPIKDDDIITSRFEQATTVADMIYDYNGRAAISTLPVPSDTPRIRYNRLFSRYSLTVPYGADHFDRDENTGCNTTALPMHNSSGSARYYSPNHQFPNGSGGIPRPEEKYIPDSKGFPFVQSVFAPDNTGRIIKKSSPGIDFSIGRVGADRHETRYFYGKPFQEEMDRWFGSEVGDASHYKKDMVIDANGQISISYLNPAGKVIATNLAGVKPSQFNALDNVVTPSAVTVDLLHKSTRTANETGTETRLEVDKYRKMLYREILVDTKQNYYFGYEVRPEKFSTTCAAQTICYDCVLDLTVSLTDECGNEFLKGVRTKGDSLFVDTVIGKQILNNMIANPGQDPASVCVDAVSGYKKNLNLAGDDVSSTWVTNVNNGTPIQLETGNYSLKKILKVNQQALDGYTQKYLEKECLKDLAYFKSIEELKISKTGCNITCEDCKTELGAFGQYDCDNPAHDPAYPCLTLEEYNALLAECDVFCDLSMKCKAEFETMLGDMSPQGQYGQVSKSIDLVNGSPNTNVASDEIKPHLFALSVFNEDNFLPIKTEYFLKGIRPNWRYPYVPYRNETGTEDFITVYKDNIGKFVPAVTDASKAVLNSDGSYRVKPQYIQNISDFINYWKPSWARSLVYYHPEYGYYELCSEQSASNTFDDKWMGITTFADAIDPVKGFGGTVTNPNFLNPVDYDPSLSLDPYFRSDNIRFHSAEHLNMMATLGNFIGGYPLKDLAYRMAVCPNTDVTCPTPCTPVALNLLTDAQRDLIWNNFKSLYNSLKQRNQDKKMAKLAIAEKSSYNGCIGEENFNPFKHNFIFTPFVALSWFPPYTPWWTQLFNFQQPCFIARYAFYKDKTARFAEAIKTTKLESYDLNLCYSYAADEDSVYVVECPDKTQKITDEGKKITELAVFKQCGQCPIAFELQTLLNEMLEGETPDLVESSAGITCSGGNSGYKSLTPRLLEALGGTMYTGLTWASGTPQEDEETGSYYLEGSFSTNPTCSLRLQFPDNTSDSIQFDDILQFYTLKYNPSSSLGTQTNGSFAVIAVVKKPGYNSTTGRHLTEEVIMQGSFPCLDLANCSFQPICRASKVAMDFQNMLNNLLSDKHPANPAPVGTSAFYNSSPYTAVPSVFITDELRYNGVRPVPVSLTPVTASAMNWRIVSTTSSVLTANFNGCTITFTDPTAYGLLNYIVSFSGITPDPDNQPNGFLITARTFNGYGSYVQLKGSTSGCLSIGTCSTELPYPYQMGKPEKEDLEYDLNANLVKKLKNGISPTKEQNVVDGTGLYIGWLEESNPCSARFEMPPVPYPSFSFMDVIGFVDVEPDKDRPGSTNFIGYARLRDGRIIPLKGYTVNCQGTVSGCRYAELVDDGIFEEYTEQEGIGYTYADNNCEEPGSISSIDAAAAESCTYIKPISGHTSITGSGSSNPDKFLLIKNHGMFEPEFVLKRLVWTQNFTGLQIGKEYTFKMHYMNAGNIDCAANDALPDLDMGKINPNFLWVEFEHALHTAPNSGTILRQELTCDPTTGWREFTYVWKANVSTLTINIYNEEKDYRNYLALDDISFGRNCPCIPDQIVSNGDFLYTSTFTTDLTLNNATALNNWEYCYTQLASTSGPTNFLSGTMKDHTTPGTGKFLLCKIMPNSDWPYPTDPEPATVWKKTMPVEPGKEYVFNAWYNFDNYYGNTYLDNQVRITLKVNNQIVQQLLNGKNAFTWQIIEGKWQSGGNTSAELEVVVEYLNTNNYGYELFIGIDDVGFTRMCQPQFCHPPQQLPLVVVDENPCLTQMNKIIDLNARIKYEQYLVDVKKEFRDAYVAKCLQSYETFLMKYNDGSNHVTLYYYDQAGNLVRTIPPQGVVPLTGPDLAGVEQDRRNGTQTVFTSHTYATTYRYNSLNQLVAQSVPDNEDLDIWSTEGINTGLNSGYIMTGLSFVSKYGITVGSEGGFGKMYKTSSSGASWEAINPEIKLDKIIDIYVVDASNIVALASNGRFLVSNDGAVTWKVKSLGLSNEMVKMRFVGTTIGSNTIYIYDKAGNMWSSTNVGTSWSSVSVTTPLPSGKDIRSMNFYGSGLNNGVAIISDNRIFYTANGGTSWTAAAGVSLNATLNYVQKVNNYLTVAAGKAGTLIRSADAGNTWTQVNTGLGVDIKEVYFGSANDGCMLDEAGNLYSTADGGNTWTKIDLVKNKLNNAAAYTDIAFINKNDGYALNNVGQLLYTNNGGKGWTNRNSANSLIDMTALYVVNANELFIVGKDGKMRYSLNGGTSLVTINESILGGYVGSIDKISRLHLSLDVASGHYKGVCNDILDIAYLVDVNLLTIPATVTYSSPYSSGLWDYNTLKNFHFNSTKQGYAVSACSIFETTDGGATWTNVYGCTYFSTPPKAIWMEYASSVHKGIIVGENGMINNTSDLIGTSLANKTNKVTPLPMRMVKGDGSGWIIVGDKGTYMQSWDGSNWTVAANAEISNFSDLTINNIYDVHVAGSGGFIRSTGDGITWNPAYTGISSAYTIKTLAINFTGTYFKGTAITSTGKMYNLEYDGSLGNYKWTILTAFSNSAVLPLISYKPDNSLWIAAGVRGKIYKTTNIGTTTPPTWTSASKFELPPLNDVKLIDQHTAYAVGENGTVIKTENLQDATSIWELQNTLSTAVLNAIDITGTKAIAVGSTGTVLKTSTGGSTWASSTLGSADLNDVSFYGSDFGVIVGSSNTIYKNTSDVISGSWSSVTPPVGGSTALNGVSIVNKKYWVVVGDGGMVYQQDELGGWNNPTAFKDVNGTSAYTVSSVKFKDVYFKDYLTGYVLGRNGELFKTTNKCSTFVKQNSGLTNTIEVISYVNNKNIFIGGGTGTNSARRINDEKNIASSIFYYDKLGRVVVSQNTKQRKKSGGPYIYSYTRYDAKGRIIEVGEKTSSTAIESTYEGETGRMSDALFNSWLSAGAASTKKEVTRTYYDDDVFVLSTPSPFTQENLRNRVASTTYETANDNADNTYDAGTHYSYDIHGNVKTLVQEFQNLPVAVADHKFKRTDYEYGIMTGKVVKVSYQKGEADQFFHLYEYDEENKLTHVFTSTNEVTWEQDARYLYYRHGGLARTELGHDKVQGIDYAYTIQGWIKGANSNTVTSATRDIGHDGLMGETGNPNRYFAQDEYGYSLGYFSGDYSAINSPEAQNNFIAEASASSGLGSSVKNLYNGNISNMVTGIRKFMSGTAGPQAMIYTYDQLNRISATSMSNSIDMASNQWQSGTSTNYNETFTYDANGNIKHLERRNDQGQLTDDLTYNYLTLANGVSKNTNKLGAVSDAVGGGTDDIKSGQVFNTGNHTLDNYQYDDIGNLTKDLAEEIDNIEWTVSGKIRSITRTSGSRKPDLEFIYDASGNRVVKIVKPAGGTSDANWKYTLYARDAQGNVLATYERKTDKTIDFPSITYDNVNQKLQTLAGTAGFSSFISQLHSGTPGLLNNMESQLGTYTSVADDILVNDRSYLTVLQNHPHLGHTLFINSDVEQMMIDLNYNYPGNVTEALTNLLTISNGTPMAPKYNLVQHMLADEYSRKNYLWGGVSQYTSGGCSGDQFFNIAKNLGYGGPDPYDYYDIYNWTDSYVNSGIKTDNLNNLYLEYENEACMSGLHYNEKEVRTVFELMQGTVTDEPDPSFPKVAARIPQVKMYVETMAMMKEYANGSQSMLEWLCEPTDNKLEYLFRGLYMYDAASTATMMISQYGISPSDEDDAVSQINASYGALSSLDIANGIRTMGINDFTMEFLLVLQGIYSAHPVAFETMFASFPHRSTTLNDPDWVQGGINELYGFGFNAFYDQIPNEINSTYPGSATDMWNALQSFSNPVYNRAWYITDYRNYEPVNFLYSVAMRQRAWISAYQQSNYATLYGGPNTGLTNYFIQIRNYFGPAFYEIFEQEYKNSSNKYLETFTLEDWNIYGSSRVGLHHPDKILYTQAFTGSIVSSKLVKSSPGTPAEAVAYAGEDAIMRGDKRFELSNHLGNVLAVVSDRITAQQGTIMINANYTAYPGGRYRVATAANVPYVFYTYGAVAGQTYKLDLRLNPNTTSTFSIIIRDYVTNREIARQVINGSTSAQDYVILYKAIGASCRIEMSTAPATNWDVYTAKVQNLFVNPALTTPVASEDYTSGTGTWAASPGGVTLSNSSGRLLVQSATLTGNDGIASTAFPTTPGKYYRIRAYIEPTGTTTNQFIFGHYDGTYTGANSMTYVNSTGWYEVDFMAVSSGTRIITRNTQLTAFSYYIDNFSFQEIVADQYKRNAEVLQATDYYAFGSPMPGRTFNATPPVKAPLLNDNFTSTTSGWWYAGATMALDAGRLKCTASSGASRVFSGVANTIPGKWYIYTLTLDKGTTSGVRLYAKKYNSGLLADEIATMTVNANGTYTLRFLAATTTTYVYAEVAPYPQSGKIFWIDNVTVVEEGSGAEMPDRYGFNGMERDNETYGEGNAYDFGARIYDSRLGRWMSIDPSQAKYPHLSPYNGFENNPVYFNDPNGKDARVTIDANSKTITISTKIVLWGADATKQAVADFQKELNATWNGSNFTYTDKTNNETYTVKFDIQVELADGKEKTASLPWGAYNPLNTDNYVEVDNAKLAKQYNEHGQKVAGYTTGGDEGLFGSGDAKAIPHEVGHMLGLDHYYDPATSQDTKGWENNVMGALDGKDGISGAGNVEQRNVNSILSQFMSTYESSRAVNKGMNSIGIKSEIPGTDYIYETAIDNPFGDVK